MKLDRRELIKSLGVGFAGLALISPAVSSCNDSTPKTNKDDGPVLQVGDKIAVVQTEYGKVRGFILRGIYNFRGIPYGADTSGENRFMPPKMPATWDEVKPVLWWGNSAPQILENRYSNQYVSFSDHWNYDDVSEDCLRINVWTPNINDDKKRPVLLWIHGGGFTNGNSIEQDGYNGENLSRNEDVVFCSVNHRLGPLGFSDFSGFAGEKYQASGNVGMLDLVFALEWVSKNISNFGGDPGNVTIMGQSGGGAKVCTLMAMPIAKGLFHKAVVLSGASLRARDKEYSEKLGKYLVEEAGISNVEIDKLQSIPWKEYIEISNKAITRMRQESGTVGGVGGFGPVVDRNFLPVHPFFPEAAQTAAHIPLIICSTFNEQSPSRFDSDLESIKLEEVKKLISERNGFEDKAAAIVDAYVKVFPDKKPIEIWSLILSNRKNTVALADSKVLQAAPVFMAWFGFQPPLFDKRMRSFHCLDICFWFANTDIMYTHSGGGAVPRDLARKMSGALARFMKSGDPNGGGLPDWPSYTTEKGEMMILDILPKLNNDPDRDARNTIPA